jgi:hypothetical protein
MAQGFEHRRIVGRAHRRARGSSVTADGQTLNFAPVKRLDPGEVAEWRVEVKAEGKDKVLLKLNMNSDALPRAVTKMEPTTLY